MRLKYETAINGRRSNLCFASGRKVLWDFNIGPLNLKCVAKWTVSFSFLDKRFTHLLRSDGYRHLLFWVQIWLWQDIVRFCFELPPHPCELHHIRVPIHWEEWFGLTSERTLNHYFLPCFSASSKSKSIICWKGSKHGNLRISIPKRPRASASSSNQWANKGEHYIDLFHQFSWGGLT